MASFYRALEVFSHFIAQQTISYPGTRGQYYKTFAAVTYDFRNNLMFVRGKPFQPNLMFADKAGNLPK